MPHLEPAYLRYIYDGLIKGSIHPENSAELPDGLIGMYEEALDERTSVVQRQKLMQRFAIWALLKKEVSAAFVAEILGDTEEEILNFISTYSAWFNSPESGKYQLYHERLKVYLLQKLSEGEIHALHEKLIARLEKAIEEQKADEFERYGLEFLGTHLYVTEADKKNLNKLNTLCRDSEFVERQIEISLHYEWPKHNFRLLAISGNNKNDRYVVNSALGLTKIYLQERADVDSIFKLFENQKIDLALNRLDSLLKNESQENKFVFYFQLLEELLDEQWVNNNHLEKIIEHFSNTVESSSSHLLKDKHVYITQKIWLREIDVSLLLNFFSSTQQGKIDLDDYNLFDGNKTDVYKTLGWNFVRAIFSENSKIQFISANSTSIDELEKKLIETTDSFDNLDAVGSYLNDIKSLKFIDGNRAIDFELYGMSEIIYSNVQKKELIDPFISYIDQLNQISFSQTITKGQLKSIHTVEPYFFFTNWFFQNGIKEKAMFYFEKSYHWLKYYINGYADGNYHYVEEIETLLEFAQKMGRIDVIDFISTKVRCGVEIWKSWFEEEPNMMIVSLGRLLTNDFIINKDIELWLSNKIFVDKNEHFIETCIPLWPLQELASKKSDFSSITSRHAYLERLDPEGKKLSELLKIDLSTDNLLRYYPLLLFSSEKKRMNLFLKVISNLRHKNVFDSLFGLLFFKYKNRIVLTIEESLLIDEFIKQYELTISSIGSMTKLSYLLRRLELELTLFENDSAKNSIAQIIKLEKIGFDVFDIRYYLYWLTELYQEFEPTSEIKHKLLYIYACFKNLKPRWPSFRFKLFTKFIWNIGFWKLKFQLLFKIKTKKTGKSKYLTNWSNVYRIQNQEQIELPSLLNECNSNLKTHLSKSMYAFDDETIVLLRTHYALNALKDENDFPEEDYKFLNLEWTLQLKDLNPN